MDIWIWKWIKNSWIGIFFATYAFCRSPDSEIGLFQYVLHNPRELANKQTNQRANPQNNENKQADHFLALAYSLHALKKISWSMLKNKWEVSSFGKRVINIDCSISICLISFHIRNHWKTKPFRENFSNPIVWIRLLHNLENSIALFLRVMRLLAKFNCSRYVSTLRVLRSGRQLPLDFPGQQQMWRRMLSAFEFSGAQSVQKSGGEGGLGVWWIRNPPYTFVRFVTGCTLPTPLFLSFTRFSCFSSFIVVCSSAVIICRFILRHMWPGITLLDFPHCQLFQLSVLSLLSASFFPFIRAEKWAQFMRSAPMGGRRQGKPPRLSHRWNKITKLTSHTSALLKIVEKIIIYKKLIKSSSCPIHFIKSMPTVNFLTYIY